MNLPMEEMVVELVWGYLRRRTGGLSVGLGGEEGLGKHVCSTHIWAQEDTVVSTDHEDL